MTTAAPAAATAPKEGTAADAAAETPYTAAVTPSAAVSFIAVADVEVAAATAAHRRQADGRGGSRRGR